MCGICGFTGSGTLKLLQRMNRKLTHRGPDDEGYRIDAIVRLGMRRLAIVDVETGKQPVSNEDKSIWVVLNGEIYNHVELRESLVKRGHKFSTHHSDTETIVHLYEEYGDLWPAKSGANGMFGVAIWDSSRNRLVLYRDRIGKKPLYWSRIGQDIVFGSEIKAVVAHDRVSRELDYGALYHYFSLKNISAPATVYLNVKQLLPGHYLVWENGEIKIEKYWGLDFSHPIEGITAEEAAGEIRELFEDAVRLRMQCDVPYGAYLSGGIDSSSVVSLMARYQSQPLKTFCLGYAEAPHGQFLGKAMDIKYSRMMSKQLGTEHYEYILSYDEFADRLPDVMRSFDEPFSGTISTFFLSTLIRSHVKVALSGDGADELFGSYLAHRLALPIDRYLRLIQSRGNSKLSQAEIVSLEPFHTPDQYQFLKLMANPDQAIWRMRLAVFDEIEKHRLLTKDFLAATVNANTATFYRGMLEETSALDPLNAALEIDQKELLPNQVLPFVDRLSMAHSIEVRCPFLDYRIIEYVNRLPGSMKIRGAAIKYVHRLAVQDLLPQELVDRPKEGFVQPNYSWMKSSLKPWVVGTLSETRLSRHGFLNEPRVAELLQAHYSGATDFSAKIWNLLCFQIWYETVIG
jgi:asparagine synthase (glutamine-hydrolysing)